MDGSVLRTADMVAAALDGATPHDPVERGVGDAARHLLDRGVPVTSGEGRARFGRAVADMLAHRSAGGLDFAESSLDVGRTVVAAWALDHRFEQSSGRETRSMDDAAATAILVGLNVRSMTDPGPHLLDRSVMAATRDSVLARASAHPEMTGARVMVGPPGRPTDRDMGLEGLGSGCAPSMNEMGDIVMEADQFALSSKLRWEEGRAVRAVANEHSPPLAHRDLDWAAAVSASASRPFPRDAKVWHDASLVAERYHVAKAGRPLRDYEARMVEGALARALRMPSDRALGTVDVARVVLLDSAMQMSARQSIDEGSTGDRRRGARMHFDDVIDAAAGADLHATARAPSGRDARSIASGAFESIPDRELARSVVARIVDARRPFDGAMEVELARIAEAARRQRENSLSVLDHGVGRAAARALGSLSKGPQQAQVAVQMPRSVGRER